MGLSRTDSEINGDFSRKSQKFSHPRVFCALADGVTRGIVYRHTESKNWTDEATWQRKKSDDIFSCLDTK